MVDPQRFRTGSTLTTKCDVLEVNLGKILGTTDGQIRKATKSTTAAMLVFGVEGAWLRTKFQ